MGTCASLRSDPGSEEGLAVGGSPPVREAEEGEGTSRAGSKHQRVLCVVCWRGSGGLHVNQLSAVNGDGRAVSSGSLARTKETRLTFAL